MRILTTKNILKLIAFSGLLWLIWQVRLAVFQMSDASHSMEKVYFHLLLVTIYGYIGVRIFFKFKKTKNKYIQDLHSSEERYRMTFENSPLGIAHFDEKGRITQVNDKFIKILGSSQEKLIGFNMFTDLTHADMQEAMESALAGDVGHYEGTYTSVTGGRTLYLKAVINRIISDTGEFLGGVAIYEDITEKKHIEAEIARLDRLDLVGQMSASIGHEIRNPMTSVRGFLQLLGRQETDSLKKDYYGVMINELDRANTIITEFLSLAKNKLVKFESADINDIIGSVGPLILVDALEQEKNIYIHKGIIPKIPLDEREMRQLIFNLVRNGLEAMPKGKDLIIRTYTEDNHVILAIQDEGAGISPDMIDKIGTPFITTKETGTGLGLAVCYSIADRHKAKIDFKTTSSGTTFFVRFKLPDNLVCDKKAS